MGKTRDLFKKIRDTKGIFHAKMGTIKDKNGLAVNQTMQIQDIILSNCEISCENIKIIEIK